MRRTRFAVRQHRHDRTGGWIECAGGKKIDGGLHRQRIGENASQGDQQRGRTPHEGAFYYERTRHGDHGRKICDHSGPLDHPPERQTPSTALRDCWHGSLLPEERRATSVP
jgi:hypothetical protein